MTITPRLALLAFLLVAALCPQGLPVHAQEGPVPVVRAELWPIDPDGEWRSLAISPDRSHVAYAVRRAGRIFIQLDGRDGKAYDVVYSPSFSPDGQHLGYMAGSDGKQFMVVDGREGRKYRFVEHPVGDGIVTYAPVFSQDGQHVAYVAQRDKQQFVVVDEQERKPYERILTDDPVFSPDGQRVAFVAERDQRQFVVVDSLEGTAYDEIVGNVLLGSHGVAYVARRGNKQFVVANGSESSERDSVAHLALSPDGTRIAYVVATGAARRVVVDGQAGKEYDDIQDIRFSPDGKRVAHAGQRGAKWLVVLDGQEGAGYDSTGPPTFSPNGQRMAHAVKRGETWLVLVDGEEGKEYDGVAVEHITFSPDGQRVAYAARRDQNAFVVVDGRESRNYELIVPRLDGRVVLYSRTPQRLEGEVWPIPVFDSATMLHVVAYRNRRFIRSEMDLTATAPRSDPEAAADAPIPEISGLKGFASVGIGGGVPIGSFADGYSAGTVATVLVGATLGRVGLGIMTGSAEPSTKGKTNDAMSASVGRRIEVRQAIVPAELQAFFLVPFRSLPLGLRIQGGFGASNVRLRIKDTDERLADDYYAAASAGAYLGYRWREVMSFGIRAGYHRTFARPEAIDYFTVTAEMAVSMDF